MTVAPELGFCGVGKETVKGTAVVPTAFVPIRQNRVWDDVVMQLDDDGMRGVMADGPIDQVQGPIYSTYDGGGPAFGDTLPWWVLGALGDVTTLAARSVADAVTNSTTLVTSATAAFTQADIGRPIIPSADFAPGTFILAVVSATNITLNKAALTAGAAKTLGIGAATTQWHGGSIKNSTTGQATSLSVTDYYALAGGTPARVFAGCQVDEVVLKFSGGGLFEYTLKLVGYPSATVAKPANAPGAVTPFTGWELTPQIAGGPSLIVLDGELTFKRGAAPVHTADGTQAPYGIQQKGLNLSGKLSLVAEDDSEYLRYLNSTKPIIGLQWQHGLLTAQVATSILMSKCNVKLGKPKHDGDFMQWEMELQALWNATDAGASGGWSPCRVGFQNLLAAATFQ